LCWTFEIISLVQQEKIRAELRDLQLAPSRTTCIFTSAEWPVWLSVMDEELIVSLRDMRLNGISNQASGWVWAFMVLSPLRETTQNPDFSR